MSALSSLSKMRTDMRNKVTSVIKGDKGESNNEEGEGESSGAKVATEESLKEERQKEKATVGYIESIRKEFLARGLSGTIEIESSFGPNTWTLELEVDASEESSEQEEKRDDDKEDVSESAKEKTSYLQKLVTSAVKKRLNRMRRRSDVYKSKAYMENLTIGESFGVTTPLGLGLASIGISLGCNVGALQLSKDMSSSASSEVDENLEDSEV